MSKRIIGTAVLGAVVLVGGITFISSLEKVPAGYNGVVYSLKGGVTGEVLGQGMHILSPLKHVAKYPVSTETMYLSRENVEGSRDDDSFNISTKDGKLVNVDVELSYHYNPERLDEVYTKWRGKKTSEIEDTYLRARIKAIANEVSSSYGVIDVYGEKRVELNTKVFNQLKEFLAEDGIELETFTFTRIEPDTQTQKAIQEKVDASQKLEQARIESENVEIENKKKLSKANADAAAKLIEAQAEADAQIISAQAQKEANDLISQSLSEGVLRLKELQKWNGQLPTVSGAGTSIIKIGE